MESKRLVIILRLKTNEIFKLSRIQYIVLAITEYSDYVARGKQGRTKEQFYKTLFDKLFTITEDDLLKKNQLIIL